MGRRTGLGHGFRIEAAIVVWESQDVFQVSVSALFRSCDSRAVFIAERD
jgi:HlyD family secretion protein